MFRRAVCLILMCLTLPAYTETALEERVEHCLRRSLAAMGTRQWTGGWGMAWSQDGRVMWGEFLPKERHWITVQPSATPTIAGVYLRAAQILEDDGYLQHAVMARDALLALQSPDGGFPQDIDTYAGHAKRGSFDDDTTTGALDFLLDLWLVTQDEYDKQAAESVANFLLVSQYPDTGGWPQWYPPSEKGYDRYITFNDGNIPNIINALLRCHKVLGDSKYLDAAIRGGECILLLQGGPGEAVWAQQYDPVSLQPAKARRFEPAGYTPAESRAVLDVLLELYLVTGEDRFLAPLPKAFEWYAAAQLPNGKWARLYEPGTKTPVYGGSREVYKPTYDVQEAVSGYGWQGDWNCNAAKALYERIQQEGTETILAERRQRPINSPSENGARTICDNLTRSGWWLSTPSERDRGFLAEAGIPEADQKMIKAGVFCSNANALLNYLEASK